MTVQQSVRKSMCCLAAFLLTAFTLEAQEKGTQGATAQGGILDVRQRDFSKNTTIALSGQWEFWWDELIAPDAGERLAAPCYAEMPAYWTGFELDGQPLPAYGKASYRLRLVLPGDGVYGLYLKQMVSAYSLYVNGRLIGGNGRVSEDPASVRPGSRPQALYFQAEDGIADIVLHIANQDYRYGGQWEAILLGSSSAISAYANRLMLTDLFLLGSIGMIGMYYLFMFLFRTEDRSPLWFGLFCLVVAARVATTGTIAVAQFWPGFSWELSIKLELAIFSFGSIFFMSFFRLLYPSELKVTAARVFLSAFGILAALTVALPVSILNHLVIVMEAITVAGLLYVVGGIVLALARKREHAAMILAGFLFFTATAINDILYSHNLVPSTYLVPLGLFAFIFTQAITLARIFSRSFSQVERLSERLSHVNLSLERFVPQEFLYFLGKSSIVDVRLGDQSLKNLTILFSDIRSFTTLSEQMTPQDNFNFLNAYLERVGPIIRDHGGFIDKYIGDAIMALFPDDPAAALDASIAIQERVRSYNKERLSWGQVPIHVGIGLHSGAAMLGIIGESRRLESTVISDTVNLASRIESLTKQYHSDVLLSGELVRLLGDDAPYDFRLIDRVTVKGKSAASDLYELVSAYAPEKRRQLLETQPRFKQALEAFQAQDYSAAETIFCDIARQNPDDLVVSSYVERCRGFEAGSGSPLGLGEDAGALA